MRKSIRFISRIGSWSIGAKLAMLIPLVIALVFTGPAWLITHSTAQLMEKQSIAETSAKIQGILDMIKTSIENFKKEADYAMQMFSYLFPERFSLDATRSIEVSGQLVPALKNGGHSLTSDFTIPDEFEKRTGVITTIFVKKDNEFIRITTSLKKEKGERATGTALDNQHPAYQRLLNGESYHGVANLFNKEYMTKYQPIQGEDGKIIGALFVGIDVSVGVKKLIKDKIKAFKVGETGYFFVLDGKSGPSYGKFVVHPTKEGEIALDARDSNGRAFLKEMIELKNGTMRYPWLNRELGETVPREKVVVFNHADGLNWIIAGGTYLEEINREAIAKAQQLALLGIFTVMMASIFIFFAIRKMVTQPLRAATEAAVRMADGDLTAGLHDGRLDEIGRLTGALNKMGQNFAQLVTEIRTSAESVDSAAQEIAADNDQLLQRTQQQVSTLEKTAASTEELTVTVKQNADHARQANRLAASARSQADQGHAVTEHMIKAMQEINTASRKVADIVSVIDEIAFQTNLLALNAAVEAARVGEQGRGFAVVAGEVRNLAQRSATAAKEIKHLIQDSVAKVNEGARFANESGQVLNEIVSAAKKVNDIVAEIATASQQQSAGIEQISAAVLQIDQMTQQNATLVGEVTTASGDLRSQAGHLAMMIGFFKTREAGALPGSPPGTGR